MSVIQNLEELFVKFQRMNQILKDNWNDGAQESFDANSLTPIVTEWSNYHSAVIDMTTRAERLKHEIEEDFEALNREVADITSSNESTLNGCCIYGFNFHQGQIFVERHFLVDQDELNFLNEERLESIAFSKFPVAEETENIHRKQQIWIH